MLNLLHKYIEKYANFKNLKMNTLSGADSGQQTRYRTPYQAALARRNIENMLFNIAVWK